MLKRIMRDFISIMVIVVVFTITTVSNTFAVVDRAIEQTYSVTLENGVPKFKSSMPKLSRWPYIAGAVNSGVSGAEEYLGGDLSIEIGNPFCTAYLVEFYAFMKIPNIAAKVIAVAAYVLQLSVIYEIARNKYKDYEICGADWLVWGSPDETSGTLSNIKEHYPVLGAFKDQENMKL